jgi:hypothetical protein
LLIQPLSLYWKRIINDKINIYSEGPRRRFLGRRPDDTFITTSSGVHGDINLKRSDFAGLLMVRDGNGKQDGCLNDDIINASLQTLDQAVRKAAPARRCIAHFVHLFYQPSHISRVEGRRACEGGK